MILRTRAIHGTSVRGSAFIAALVVTSANLSGCGAKKSDAPDALTAQIALDPWPAHSGAEQVVVTVRDRAGAPVSGARVTVLTSTPALTMGTPMPMKGQGQAGESLTAIDKGGGVYRAAAKMTKRTSWTIVVHVRKDTAEATAERSVDVR